eukprot:TRINITY_DN670_c0_g1_i1.p1 TRINITY_DN670_c0_g1~~TRINITY_DN670_c0_g1_i1.p1  ORF type:complete len:194 (+),score=32.65 TRINITY_DN670_c0_g1_i1:270-851(+)
MCFFDEIPPPTQEAKDAVDNLRILFVCQMLLACLLIFVNPFFGLLEFMTAFLLYLAYVQMNFCTCIMYMMLCGINMITVLFYFGAMLKDEKPFYGESTVKDVANTILVIALIFYMVAIYFTYQAYKVFKAIFFQYTMQYENDQERNSRGRNRYETYGSTGNTQRSYTRNSSGGGGSPPAFGGRGVAIGSTGQY